MRWELPAACRRKRHSALRATRVPIAQAPGRLIVYLRRQSAKQVVAATAVTRDEITEGVRDTIRLAKKGTPVLAKDGTVATIKNADETETEIRKPDLSSANRGYEIMAKMSGFMVDVVKTDDFEGQLENMGSEDVRELLGSLIEALDPNAKKMFLDGLKKEAAAEGGESMASGEEGPTLQ